MSSLDTLSEMLRTINQPAQGERAAQVELNAQETAAQARTLSSAETLRERLPQAVSERLLPHQWTGMQFGYAAKRFLLGDGMGLGKTLTTIGWLDLVHARRTLIICQAEIAPQFAGEVEEWASHRELTLLTKLSPAMRHLLLNRALKKDGVIVVNYEMFRRDKIALEKLLEWHADSVIIDEAHNLKNTASSNYKLCELLVMADNVCPSCGGHIFGLKDDTGKLKKCEHCGWKYGDQTAVTPILPFDRLLQTKSVKYLALTTGTPILNSPLDLYSLLHLIDPVRFATQKAFTEAFCSMNYAINKMEFEPFGLQQLKPMISSRYIARTLEDAGVVLPPQHIRHIRVELNSETHPDQYRVVQQISEQAKIILQSGESHSIMHMMTLVMRKRQSMVYPAGIEIRDTDKDSPTYGEVIFRVGDDVQESVKLDAVCEEIARQHTMGKRQIVFSQFKTALRALETRLHDAGYRVVRFDGDTSDDARADIKTDFRSTSDATKFDVVLIQYRSGGTGLNLQGATVTHILDEEWNPGRRDQAYARTHRMGQEHDTEVFIYRVPASVDVWMANLVRLKERMINQFNDIAVPEQQEILSALRDMILEDAA